MFSVFINAPLSKHVSFVIIVGIKDGVPIDSKTFVFISCYDYDGQSDAQLSRFQGRRLP